MITTYERGKIEGRVEGKVEGRVEGRLEGLREMAVLQLEAKFPRISSDVKQRLEALDAERLRELLVHLVKAQTLKELQLED